MCQPLGGPPVSNRSRFTTNAISNYNGLSVEYKHFDGRGLTTIFPTLTLMHWTTFPTEAILTAVQRCVCWFSDHSE